MFLGIVYLLVGGVFLYFSGDLLVKGASSLAIRFKLSQFFIGLTIVALGTSAPEFFVSFISALNGYNDISFGNVIGSNIVNIGLVLGIAFLIFEKNKYLNINKRDLYFLLLSTFLILITAFLGVVSRFFGFIFVLIFTIFIINALRKSKVASDEITTLKRWKEVCFITLGIIGLPIGSNIFVKGGVLFASSIGVSEALIAVTIMAFGTSLPELATSIISSIKKNHGISVGNVIVSNIFNAFGVLGVVSIFKPIKISGVFLNLELPFLIIFSFLTYFFVTRKNTRHFFGGILIVLYIIYVGLVLYRS
jgi:cation:H+ antiporter